MFYNYAMTLLTFSSFNSLPYYNSTTKQLSIIGNLSQAITDSNSKFNSVCVVDRNSENIGPVIPIKWHLIQYAFTFFNVSAENQYQEDSREWFSARIPNVWQYEPNKDGTKCSNIIPTIDMILGRRPVTKSDTICFH